MIYWIKTIIGLVAFTVGVELIIASNLLEDYGGWYDLVYPPLFIVGAFLSVAGAIYLIWAISSLLVGAFDD